MTTFVALLRGINVGGRNKVAMADLRALAEGLRYESVSTYINSGNLVFTAPGADPGDDGDHATALGRAITDELGLTVDVAVRTLAELAAAVAANPYPDGDPKQVQVAFLMGPAAPDVETRIAALATAAERFSVGPREIYVDYGQGLARSKLAVGFANAVGVSATSRNIRTCRAVLAAAQGSMR